MALQRFPQVLRKVGLKSPPLRVRVVDYCQLFSPSIISNVCVVTTEVDHK